MNPQDYDKNPGTDTRPESELTPLESERRFWARHNRQWQTSAGQASNDNAATAWDWERIFAALFCLALCVIVWAMLFKPLAYALADAWAWVVQ